MRNNLLQGKREEVKDILAKCYNDMSVFAKTLFPDRFNIPFSPKIHGKIFKLIDDDSLQKVAIEAPRGVGKTSITNFLYPAKSILFKENRYIVPVSHSQDHAIEQSENLKDELTSNQTILKLFGDISSDKWSVKRWETEWDDGYRTRILPRGAGQQIRGRLFNNSRPDLIIVDDLEDPEETDSPTQRKKKKEWFFSDLMNSVQKYGPHKNDWRIIVIGSYLHEDSLISNLVDDSNWASERLAICDENLKSNWEAGISDEEIEDMYQDFEEENITDVFYREYMSKPTSSEDNTFKEDYFRYYSEKELNTQDPNFETVVIGDPAKTSDMNSADSSIIGAGVNTRTNRIYFRRLELGKFHPDEYMQALFDMCIELNAHVLGVEVTGLNEYISYPIKNQMAKEGYRFEFVELNAKRGTRRGEGKNNRIASLLPFYRQGLIYHNKSECGPLETQLVQFPHSKKKDAMDAASYIIKMLDEGLRYFEHTHEDESAYDIEQEYEELEYDDGLNQKNFNII